MMRGVSIRCGGRARWAALKWSERTCASPASPSLVEVNAQLWEGVPRRWVQYAAVGQLRTKGHPVSEQDAARLSPLGHAHVNGLFAVKREAGGPGGLVTRRLPRWRAEYGAGSSPGSESRGRSA